MRVGLFVAVFVLLIGTPSPSPSGQKTADSAQRKAETNKQTAKPSSAPTSTENPNQSAVKQNGTAIKSAKDERTIRVVSLPRRSKGDILALVCTVILTLAGVIGITVAVCTLRTLKRQTRAIRIQGIHMARQTRVLQQQVKVMIDSERAWLMGDTIDFVLPPGKPPDTVSYYWVHIPVKNFGRTVAQAFESSAEVEVASWLPAVPEYHSTMPCVLTIVPNGIHKLSVGVEPQQMQAIRERKTVGRLYIYGFIRYRDIGSQERETRFCYFYYVPVASLPEPEGFYPGTNAPREYNKCT